MKILFTGASSFSGYWIARELSLAGHEVTVTFYRPLEKYEGVRGQRIQQLLPFCRSVFDCPFGTEAFLQVISESRSWDMLCHHAADVNNYKSPNFDVAEAVSKNAFQLTSVLNCLKEKQCQHLLLTGTVFEPNEGAGSDGLRAVSPYGLSKGLTSSIFHYYTERLGIKMGKFVIPNPFGPYEELRFTSFIIQQWFQKKVAVVQSPDYVRDNIPISLLAKSYVAFANSFFSRGSQTEKINPSCYVESQGAFTQRFAREMASRLKLPCEVELKIQKEYSEPKVRINTTLLDFQKLQWDETKAWDELAEYYQAMQL